MMGSSGRGLSGETTNRRAGSPPAAVSGKMMDKAIEVMARECHEVLMLIVEAGVKGRWRQPASNVSMITMREPQRGQRWSRAPRRRRLPVLAGGTKEFGVLLR